MTDFDLPVGKGAFGIVNGKRIVSGQCKISGRTKIDVSSACQRRRGLREDGATAIFAACDGVVAGVLAIADPVKAIDPGGARGR